MNVRKIIEKYGFMCYDIADEMQVSEAALSQQIGPKGNPTVKTLRAIADAINRRLEREDKPGKVYITDFFEDEKPKPFDMFDDL